MSGLKSSALAYIASRYNNDCPQSVSQITFVDITQPETELLLACDDSVNCDDVSNTFVVVFYNKVEQLKNNNFSQLKVKYNPKLILPVNAASLQGKSVNFIDIKCKAKQLIDSSSATDFEFNLASANTNPPPVSVLTQSHLQSSLKTKTLFWLVDNEETNNINNIEFTLEFSLAGITKVVNITVPTFSYSEVCNNNTEPLYFDVEVGVSNNNLWFHAICKVINVSGQRSIIKAQNKATINLEESFL